MSEHVRVDDSDGVRVITLDRTDKKNAITHAMYAKTADAITEAQTDAGVQVVLITGAGDFFTAGNDIQEFITSPPEWGAAEPAPVERFLTAISSATKPLVAAVNGPAVGVGATMLLHCDLVYAAETASLSFPFVDLALTPEAGATLLLPRRVGRARAGELMLLGEPVSASEAVELGLVARSFPAAALHAESVARARRLAKKSPTAVRETKRLVTGDHDVITARMTEEGAVFARLLRSEEFGEAAAAFMEKRAPDFSRFR